jgi:hypothetical protein
MSLYYRTLIQGGLLLDTYPNAAVAYSLRKLRTAYSGSPIRVRRSVDNAEQDFGFDELNNTLIDWIGYNLWTYSEQMQQSVWAKSNVTAVADILIAPDGNLTGDVLLEQANNATHSSNRGNTVTAGVSYTVSFYIKANGRDFVRISSASNLANTIGQTPQFWINFLTGTIYLYNGQYAVAPTITNVGNGWFFVTYGCIAQTNASSTFFQLLLSPDGTTTTYLGDITKGIGLWGIQLSQTSTVKPYQKTEINAGGNGFVTTWYDQSGNGRNANQTTPTGQAQIVINGNIIIDTTTLKPTTTWTADSYVLINGVNPNTRYLSVSVNTRLTINDQILHLGTTNNPGTVNGQQSLRWRGGDGLIQSFRHNQSSHGLITTNGSYIIMSEKDSNNLKSVYINGFVNSSGTEVPANGFYMNQFGRSSSQPTTAQYQEFIYWDSEQSANRANIETLINNYYAIY